MNEFQEFQRIYFKEFSLARFVNLVYGILHWILMEASPSCLTATQMCRLESVNLTEFIWMLVLRIRSKTYNSCDSFYFSVSFTLPWQISFSNQPDLFFFRFILSLHFFFSTDSSSLPFFLPFYALIPSYIFYLFFFFFNKKKRRLTRQNWGH